MQAVILCAGKSMRTHPLTVERPKPLLKIANKTILEHNLDALNGLVEEVIVVVGFKKEMIEKSIEDIKKNYTFKITSVEQKEQLGTGHAVLAAQPHIKNKFIVLMGDDLYSRENIENCLRKELCILSSETKTPELFGTIQSENGFLVKIFEKTNKPPSNLANAAMYVLNRKIFNVEVKKSERGEIEITDMISELAKTEKIAVVNASNYWLPIVYPWNILEANELILKKLEKSKTYGIVESNATVKGPVIIGKNTIVKGGSYIEGPIVIGEGCEIGPNCYIRPCTSIGNNCKIGNSVTIKNSVIMDNTKIKHLSYFGDSIIGFDVNIGAGTVAANFRHDNKTIKTMVKGELIDTERRKFGTVIGDGVHTGINTSIYPGRKIWPGVSTLPGEVVKEDKEK